MAFVYGAVLFLYGVKNTNAYKMSQASNSTDIKQYEWSWNLFKYNPSNMFWTFPIFGAGIGYFYALKSGYNTSSFAIYGAISGIVLRWIMIFQDKSKK